MTSEAAERDVVIIGAGPSGLTAAYQLSKRAIVSTVLESQDKVGGLAKTENYKGFHFDMGGHRFFTKSKEVNEMWHEVLAEQFLQRPRLSRIYYKKKFFDYPLKPLNALMGLGFLESVRILISYVRWRILPYRVEETFEQWVTNRFGRRLFQTFFKTYTEKVWGISCSELKAEWAAQRIKNLSLRTAILNMFFKSNGVVKSLIEQFDYPRLGPGMMWRAVTESVESRGARVLLNSPVVKICRSGNRIESVVAGRNGHRETFPGTDFISSMPLTEFVMRLDPPAPHKVVKAANRLKYRDFLTVCLIVKTPHLFADNWIYIHDPEVKVGRIQNFKNWSPEMVPDPAKTSLGLEYFCNEGDDLWNMEDEQLVELGKREMDRLGLASYADIEDGCVFRVPKSYPVYDSGYRDQLAVLREYVEGLENLQTIGRNGLHRYNNQDHAMLTGMLAVRNMADGEVNDLWNVNADQEYHEEVRDVSATPELEKVVEEVLEHAFPKLDRVAFGASLGAVAGVVLFLLTSILVLKGGTPVGPNLALLGQYLPGFEVSLAGSLIGLGYGFAAGFAVGWVFAFLKNVSVFLYLAVVRRRAEHRLLRRLLEYI